MSTWTRRPWPWPARTATPTSVRLSVVHADAFGYMRQMAANQKTFGVVVLDPPKLIPDRDEVPSASESTSISTSWAWAWSSPAACS